MSYYEKLSSAIYNDVVSGLRGYSSTPTMSIEQLEDDCVDERLQIIKEYSLKGLVPYKDLLVTIPCIQVDCKSMDRCRCNASDCDELTAHFEVPQLLTEFLDGGIYYIGTTDMSSTFIYYTNPTALAYHKYRKRGKNKPFVWIDITPNENNMYDGFIFNAPLIQQLTVIAIVKDLRQLDTYGCCSPIEINNLSFIDTEIKKRLTEKKLRYYRMLIAPPHPNDQIPR